MPIRQGKCGCDEFLRDACRQRCDINNDIVLLNSNKTVVISGLIKNIVGLEQNQVPVAIDYRPANGKLYLLARAGSNAQLYTLESISDTQVRATKSGPLLFIQGTDELVDLLGNANIDFNPVVDRLRIITTAGQNFRVNVDTGSTIVDGTIIYDFTVPLPINTAVSLGGIAYTNSLPEAESTQLQGIDNILKNLVQVNPANDGTVVNLRKINVNFDLVRGFDIRGENNTAYVVLDVNNKNSLYRINLSNGNATKIQDIKCDNINVIDLALRPLLQ